ncbi:hypothetical protein [Burkholderia pseudomultivorans]|uniref:hypothetical protein n=1 Tax=Burkholderia pseudomultivorans TaxID=1207504 RepID=UPI000754675A|nr:hypothetical protein [Burkholderia pseudomultivorans]KWF05216.1 hypothetical protein WT55_22470 [Burkholderia pseudomultivorans]KWI47539.1 hypothetical protein WT72_32080 [Burkholderia pseudomultivorans]
MTSHLQSRRFIGQHAQQQQSDIAQCAQHLVGRHFALPSNFTSSMNTASLPIRDILCPVTAGRLTRIEAATLNPLLNVILAFWAMFHCRHARPPLRRDS